MAVTKRFTVLQSTLVADKTNETAKEAGILAVKAIYSNDDAEMALLLLNDTPQFIRKAFSSWLRTYGVNVNDPKIGTHAYTIGNELSQLVKDKSKQAKIFAIFTTMDVADVLKQEMKVAAAKKAKKLEGTPAQRAGKKIASLVASMKKDGDVDGAAYLNDKFAANAPVKVVRESEVQFGIVDGDTIFELNADETASLMAHLMAIRENEKQKARLAA